MQYNAGDREEALRRARRAEQMARMRREKQLQEQRRRMIRKMAPLGAGVMALLVIVFIWSFAGNAGSDKKSEMQQAQEEQKTQPLQSAGVGITDKIWEEEKTQQVQSADMETADKAQGTGSKNKSYVFEKTQQTVTINSEEVISSNAVLINEKTDTIVAAKGEKERISPASMTKVLTVLTAAEHLTEADLDKTFTMTREIIDYAYVNDCSLVGFAEGEEVTLRDLFYGTVLHSGGDAAVALAVYTAGSHEAFVDMMNEKLEEMGLSGSAHFTNCVGLYDENHYCTVYDMAVIMKAALQNELCREFLSRHTYTTSKTAEHPEGIEISNWFLRRIEDKETGGEVLCAKTGYVVQSKNCAVSYGIFADDTPYICVTAGATSNWRCIYDHVEIYNEYVKS